MSIQQIKFKHYKSFENEQIFDIKPITLVIGKNNAGKTALIKLPLMLSEWLKANGDLPLRYNNDKLSFAKNWKELFFNQDKNKQLKFEMNIDEIKIITHIQLNGYQYLIALAKCIYEGKLHYSARWTGEEVENPLYNLTYFGIEEHYDTNEYTEYYAPRQDVKLSFEGMEPIIAEKIAENDEYVPISPIPHLGGFQYFTGIRHTFADANLSFDELKRKEFDVKGEFAIHQLYKDVDLLQKVQDWYIENMEGWGIEIEKNAGNDGFYLFLTDFNTEGGARVPITQTGQGITQVLPLVVSAYMNVKPPDGRSLQAQINRQLWQSSTIIIEQPELHLHPAAHGNLVQLFAESALANGHNYILETHSEVMLLRIRRLVAEGVLKPEQVAIYWVDSEEGSSGKRSFLKKIEVDENGMLDDWPEGIFADDHEEVLAIRRAQRKKEVIVQ